MRFVAIHSSFSRCKILTLQILWFLNIPVSFLESMIRFPSVVRNILVNIGASMVGDMEGCVGDGVLSVIETLTKTVTVHHVDARHTATTTVTATATATFANDVR